MAIEDPRLTRRITSAPSTSDPNYSGVLDTLAKGGIGIANTLRKKASTDRVADGILNFQDLQYNWQVSDLSVAERRKKRIDWVNNYKENNPNVSSSELLQISNAAKINDKIKLQKVGDQYVNVDPSGSIVGTLNQPIAKSSQSQDALIPPEKTFKNNLDKLSKAAQILPAMASFVETDIAPAIKSEKYKKGLADVSLETATIANKMQAVLEEAADYDYSNIKNIAQLTDKKAASKQEFISLLRQLGLQTMNSTFSSIADGDSPGDVLPGNVTSRLYIHAKKDVLKMLTPESYQHLGITDADINGVFKETDALISRYETIAVDKGEASSYQARAKSLLEENAIERLVLETEMYNDLSSEKKKLIAGSSLFKDVAETAATLKLAGYEVTAVKVANGVLGSMTPIMYDSVLSDMEKAIKSGAVFDGYRHLKSIADPSTITLMTPPQRKRFIANSNALVAKIQKALTEGVEFPKGQSKKNAEDTVEAIENGIQAIQSLEGNKKFTELSAKLVQLEKSISEMR